MKNKILVIYPEMMLGGSTTSLISLLNCFDNDKYDVDLQLYRNRGELLDKIPKHINLLPPCSKYDTKVGRIIKAIKYVFSGYCFKTLKQNGKLKKEQIKGYFVSKYLSKKNKKHYDYAISFLEGWSNKYLATMVNADKKYGWIHSTFSNVAPNAKLEEKWIDKVDKIVFVASDCTKDFISIMPQYKDKAVTIENILDSSFIVDRSKEKVNDEYYDKLSNFDGLKIITVCRTSIETKGLDRIVNCVKTLKQQNKNFIWYIVGGNCDYQELLSLIKENNIEDKLFAIGTRLNPYPYIKLCDIFCMPSRWEGKPMSITESLMLGVPPVVTNYLSANEQIKDGYDGIVLKNDDTSIIPVIQNMIDDNSIVLKLKENIKKQEYGNKSYFATIEKILFD